MTSGFQGGHHTWWQGFLSGAHLRSFSARPTDAAPCVVAHSVTALMLSAPACLLMTVVDIKMSRDIGE
jgi:hypothetical protein